MEIKNLGVFIDYMRHFHQDKTPYLNIQDSKYKISVVTQSRLLEINPAFSFVLKSSFMIPLAEGIRQKRQYSVVDFFWDNMEIVITTRK